jgi:hypothetical protein
MTLTTVYHVSPFEQEPLIDCDLLKLRDLAPTLEPALMELQYRRSEMNRIDEELMVVKTRLGDIEDV